jgi:hypothetical protein
MSRVDSSSRGCRVGTVWGKNEEASVPFDQFNLVEPIEKCCNQL